MKMILRILTSSVAMLDACVLGQVGGGGVFAPGMTASSYVLTNRPLIVGSTNTVDASNFSDGVAYSISNIFIGISMGDLQNNLHLSLGPSIAFPDDGGLAWEDGSFVHDVNNAHGTAPGGDVLSLGAAGSIALISRGVNGVIQIGRSGPGHELVEIQYDDDGTTTVAGFVPHSKLLSFRTFGGNFGLQGYGAYNTNSGSLYAGLKMYSGDADSSLGGGESSGTAREVAEFKTNGVRIAEGFIQGRVRGAALASTALDFSLGGGVDYDCGATNIALTTTGRTGNWNDFERRVFTVSAKGMLPSITYNATWQTNQSVVMPGSLTNGQTLRLELESRGPGESNVLVVAAGVYYDTSFYWTTNATNFFTRSGVVDLTYKSAVNQYVIDLQARGVWNKFATNGALWVLRNGVTNNLVSGSYSLTNHGTFTYNGAGFTGDGSSGYYDTGFKASAAGAFDATNMTYFAYAATNNSPAANATFMGSRDVYYSNLRYDVSVGWRTEGFNSGTIQPQTLLFSLLNYRYAGDMANVAISRTNSATQLMYSGGMVTTLANASGGKDDGDVLIGAVNNGPGLSPQNYYPGTIKAVGIGYGMTPADFAVLADATTHLNDVLGRKGIQQ